MLETNDQKYRGGPKRLARRLPAAGHPSRACLPLQCWPPPLLVGFKQFLVRGAEVLPLVKEERILAHVALSQLVTYHIDIGSAVLNLLVSFVFLLGLVFNCLLDQGVSVVVNRHFVNF